MTREGWLRCRVFDGVFRDEFVIGIVSADGEQRLFAVPRTSVKGRAGDAGKVKVSVFNDQGAMWAKLPTSEIRTIPILDHQLLVA